VPNGCVHCFKLLPDKYVIAAVLNALLEYRSGAGFSVSRSIVGHERGGLEHVEVAVKGESRKHDDNPRRGLEHAVFAIFVDPGTPAHVELDFALEVVVHRFASGTFRRCRAVLASASGLALAGGQDIRFGVRARSGRS